MQESFTTSRPVAVLMAFVAAMGFAMLYQTVAVPHFGTTKPFYALSATPVFALAFGRGYALLDRGLGTRGQAVLFGGVATILAVFYLSYLG